MSVSATCGCGVDLERVELPLARVLGGRRPFLYALGHQGVPFVEARIGTATLPVQSRRLDRLDPVFVDHVLKAAALWANLKAQLRDRRVVGGSGSASVSSGPGGCACARPRLTTGCRSCRTATSRSFTRAPPSRPASLRHVELVTKAENSRQRHRRRE
jgi:hypothetical protein